MNILTFNIRQWLMFRHACCKLMRRVLEFLIKNPDRNVAWELNQNVFTSYSSLDTFFCRFLGYFNPLPIWFWPLQWWVTGLSVTGYSWRGGRREGNFQNRRKNNSWLGNVTPKSKQTLDLTRLDGLTKTEWTNQWFRFRTLWNVCTSTFCKWMKCSVSNKTCFPSGRHFMICKLFNVV